MEVNKKQLHAFNGELFVQATWDTSSSRLFRTQFRMVSPKRISNPNNTGDSRNCRAGVQINDSGAALGYYVSEDGYPGWMPQKWTWMTGYNGIIARLQQAASDPMVDGILLDMDTPGGMVAGAFDCADIIARVRDIKPVPARR